MSFSGSPLHDQKLNTDSVNTDVSESAALTDMFWVVFETCFLQTTDEHLKRHQATIEETV